MIIRNTDLSHAPFVELLLQFLRKLFTILATETVDDSGRVVILFMLFDNVVANGIFCLTVLLTDLIM
jgi:hypothetical protein